MTKTNLLMLFWETIRVYYGENRKHIFQCRGSTWNLFGLLAYSRKMPLLFLTSASPLASVRLPTDVIHLVVCLTTGPKPLPKPALHIVRSRASAFKWEYPLLSLRSSNSFLRLLPRFPVTSISPCIFPSITRCRRQFLRKMWRTSMQIETGNF